MNDCTNFGNFGNGCCCINGSFCPEPGDNVCDCCLPGLKATLEFAAGNLPDQLPVSINTIDPSSGSSTEGNIITPVTNLVKFDDKVISICNIEMITFSELNTTQLETLIAAVSIDTPEECKNCCSEELRLFFNALKLVNKSVFRIASNKNKLLASPEKEILGTGLGVVILRQKVNPARKPVHVVNLCYISTVGLVAGA